MGKIMCAIRGGEASYRTQDAAIKLAKEKGDQLFFLYVVNTSFLDKTARAFRRNVVTDEMTRMGHFLLDMAEERAQSEDVEPVLIVRYGDVRQELKAAAREQNVSAVVLGRPKGSESIFDEKDIEEFADQIEAETQAKVYIL